MPRLSDIVYEESLEIEEAEKAETTAYEEELLRVSEELELFDHPSWKYFEERLVNDEKASIETLIAGHEDVRNRIKYIRYLLSLPDRLRERRSQLTRLISRQEVE